MSYRYVVTSITAYKNRLFAGLFDDHRLIEANAVSKEPPLIGRIYAVKVTNVSPNLNACFVSAGDDLIFYLPFEELENAVFIKKTSSNKAICAGDELLVQVTTDALKTKNARCTGKLAIAGTFCVVTSFTNGISVSKKLPAQEKERLVSVAENAADQKNGIIIRTVAGSASDDVIIREIELLQNKMCDVLEYGTKSTPFTCIYADRSSFISHFADVSSITDFIVTDDREVHEEFMRYAKEINPGITDKLMFYNDDYPLNKLYSFEHQIEKALKDTVHLKSGGNIVITVTEALTVIDVNTGSNVKNTEKEDMILLTNREAAQEIAFQLRLRNISGIVIIDFIDMDKNGRDIVISDMQSYTKNDSCKVNILDFTKLGLLELTRQKERQPLYRQVRV